MNQKSNPYKYRWMIINALNENKMNELFIHFFDILFNSHGH
jgi:hypothetical protein